jgi:PAT family beta-lactamase induction signal transducer AmpG
MHLKKKLFWIAILYFAEGLPFGVIQDTFPVYFRLHGLSLKDIGLMSLIALPWSLKFLWAPAVDLFGKYKNWVAAAQFMMAAFLFVMIAVDPSSPGVFLWVCMASLAVLSATQDIAIDAYSIEILETREMGAANGVRVSAYRVALLVAGGVFVALGGWLGWSLTFMIAAGILVLCGIFSMNMPPVQAERKAKSVAVMLTPLNDFLTRPGVLSVAIFILIYKAGDMAMGPMVKPFWVDRGLSTTEIGLITGTMGVVASITGALVGGIFTSRFGIFNGLWFLGLWQGASNLGYACAAALPDTGHAGVYIASAIESFCGGLGTASFLAFLMSVCKKDFAATQYALLSALFGMARAVSGTTSGWAAATLGYADYFLLTFFMAAPAYLFLRPVKRWIPENSSDQP